MEVSRIIAEIDAQIAKLQQARNLLEGSDTGTPVADKPRRGRPRKDATNTSATAAPKKGAGKPKRNLSPEARKRIADAQKRRWAERRAA